MSKTINLNLDHDYWKREPLIPIAVSRLGDNDKSILVSFNRPYSDDEMRRIHEMLKLAMAKS